MAEEKRLAFLEEDQGTDDNMENFKILVFYTNPMRRSIKVWFANGFTSYMRSDRFVDNICALMGEDYRPRLNHCLSEYGGVYILDRIKKELRSASPGREAIDRSPQTILDKYIAEHPYLQENTFKEVNLNNVFDKYSKIKFFR